jgi:hypothetical protein
MLIEAVLGSIVVITCGSLWFADRLMRRELAASPLVSKAISELRPWQNSYSECQLCGQRQNYLRVKALDGCFEWRCGFCHGKYRTALKPIE